MCGIFALFLRRPLTDGDVALGRAGTLALAHRGPDHGGEWIDRIEGVFIGHRRLAILDLAARSNQPMVRDGLVVAFNGEIYNFRSLRTRLEASGATFATTSDTEVLARAWQRSGVRCLEEFDGMLAAVLWDGTTGWLALDRFGEKQLYYAETADGVYVSSELAVLVQVLGLPPADPSTWVVPLLALGYVPGPRTAVKGVRRLPPAGVLRIERGRTGSATTYWRFPVGTPGRGAPVFPARAEVRRVQDALAESLETRLEADVPLCVFLSSGVDSALVAALLRRQFDRSAQCFTVDFGAASKAEIEGATRIATALELPHRALEGTDPSAVATPDRVLDLFGQPNDNLTVVSVRQMAAAARREGYRVGLTGMGGDEMFFGYNKHSFLYRNRRIFALPEWLRLGLGALARPFARHHSTARGFLATAAVPDFERFLAVKAGGGIDWLHTLPGYEAWARAAFTGWSGRVEQDGPVFDVEHTMPDSLLPAQDVGSMRAGVEFRTPFLSPRVAEAIAALDSRALLAFGQKAVLRRILEGLLPAETLRRDKQGFIFPQDVFLGTAKRAPAPVGVPVGWSRAVWEARARPEASPFAVRLLLLAEYEDWMRRTASTGAAPGLAVGAGR